MLNFRTVEQLEAWLKGSAKGQAIVRRLAGHAIEKGIKDGRTGDLVRVQRIIVLQHEGGGFDLYADPRFTACLELVVPHGTSEEETVVVAAFAGKLWCAGWKMEGETWETIKETMRRMAWFNRKEKKGSPKIDHEDVLVFRKP